LTNLKTVFLVVDLPCGKDTRPLDHARARRLKRGFRAHLHLAAHELKSEILLRARRQDAKTPRFARFFLFFRDSRVVASSSCEIATPKNPVASPGVVASWRRARRRALRVKRGSLLIFALSATRGKRGLAEGEIGRPSDGCRRMPIGARRSATIL